MEFDPKCAWALKNMHLFPVEVNHAPLEMLLRVPGIGAKNAYKIIEARKYTKLTFESLTKMRVALKRAKHFITCNGKFFGAKNEEAVRGFLAQAEEKDSAVQLDLFSLLSTPQNAMIALNGQL
jgi:predicted DNA-binding helix-hairpin-helix protein